MQTRVGRKAIVIASFLTVALMGAGLVFAGQAAARGNVGAPVRAAGTGHTITVIGHGEISVAPDTATITLGVETTGDDAATALSANATKMTAVIGAVEAQGVPSSHIQTNGLSMYFDSQRRTYVANHNVSVKVDDIAKVGAILDAGVHAGANNSWGVSFGLQDPTAAQAQALQAAVANAQSRATAIAQKLGVQVSGVGSASEVSYSTPPVVYGPQAGAPVAASSTPVQPGQLSVTADLTVVYTFG